MKRFLASKGSSVALCLILLIQSTISLGSLQCPTAIAKDCYCQREPKFIFNCTQNNEQITFESKILSPWELLKVTCSNVFNERIFESLNFDRNTLNNSKYWVVSINECPTSVVSLIGSSILSRMNQEAYGKIYFNELTFLPQNIFQYLSRLSFLDFEGNELRNLSENTFAHQINLKSLKLTVNKLPILPENIFKNLTN